MKNGIFGSENDTPIQKKYEKSISDDIDIDLGDDIFDKDNINKKEDDSNKKFNKDNNDNSYLVSDSEKRNNRQTTTNRRYINKLNNKYRRNIF